MDILTINFYLFSYLSLSLSLSLWYSLDIKQHVQEYDNYFHLLMSYILVFVPAP